MAISSLIFHRLTRWQEQQPSELRLSENASNVTADHEALFSQLKKLFQFRSGKFYGHFDSDFASAPLQNWLREHLKQKIGFEQLTHLYIKQLKELLDLTSETFEISVLFILEGRADGDRCYIFALDTDSGLLLDKTLQLDTIEFLNTTKVDLAVRIDLEDWQPIRDNQVAQQEDTPPYLCMVRGRSVGKTGGAKIGEAFSQSVGFANSVDTAKETEMLMDIVAHYTKQEEPSKAAQIRKRTYDYCVEQQQQGEPVPLNTLSGYLDENQPTRFTEFAKNQGDIDSQELFRPDTRKLKHLVRLSGKGNGLSLSFSSDLIQQTVLFDEKTDTLTITAIPKNLKKQIVEHLKKKPSE